MSDTPEPADIPPALRQLIGESLERVRSHPQHELGQDNRRTIYEVLYASPRGQLACKWLAILSTRRVRHIYLESMLASRHATSLSAVSLFDHMLDLAEEFVIGTMTLDQFHREVERGEIEDFYHSILVAANDEFAGYVWLATLAAYNALEESMGRRPLEMLISGEVEDEQGNKDMTPSDTWPDPWLAGRGMADDAAVDAAYAFASMTSHKDYDAAKVLAFWEWWLQEAIPQAWVIAAETQRYHREFGFPTSPARYAPSYPP